MAETLTRIRVRFRPFDTQHVSQIELGGVAVGLRFRWLAAEDRWVVWVLDSADAVLLGPRYLVPGYDLLAGAQHNAAVPRGQLFVHSAPATRESVDAESILYWRSP